MALSKSNTFVNHLIDNYPPEVILYHGRCPDGSIAACILSRNIQPYPYFHGVQPGKDVQCLNSTRDAIVYMVDVICSIRDLRQIINMCKKLIIIDHHRLFKNLISFFDDLVEKVILMTDSDLIKNDTELGLKDTRHLEILDYYIKNDAKVLFYHDDNKRSATEMAWDIRYNLPRPWLVTVAGDRDLWRQPPFHPNSELLSKAILQMGILDSSIKLNKNSTSTREDHIIMENIETFLSEQHDMNKLLEIGRVVKEIEDKYIKEAVKRANFCEFHPPQIREQYMVKLTTCERFLRSDVGAELCNDDKIDFSAMWTYSVYKNEWWISLRANSDRIDLNKLCRKLGGGGHIRAAGFTIDGNKEHILDYFTPLGQDEPY